MRSKHGKAHLLMLILVITALVLGCSAEEPKEQAETTPVPPVNELGEFVAQAIVDDCRSPEGVYVAHVISTSASCESVPPLRIWKYEQGRLVSGDRDAFLLALTSSKPSDWPPFVFLFAFSSETPDYAVVDVHTLYDMGIMPGSRGGNAATWELEKQDDQWTVVSKETYMFWD